LVYSVSARKAEGSVLDDIYIGQQGEVKGRERPRRANRRFQSWRFLGFSP
jgi:hypothetical protein